MTIVQRATFDETFRFPLDGSSSEVYAELWTNDKRRRKLIDFTVTWVTRYEEFGGDPNDIRSTLTISLTPDQTAELRSGGYWDLLWVWPDGREDIYLEGDVSLNYNVTDSEP